MNEWDNRSDPADSAGDASWSFPGADSEDRVRTAGAQVVALSAHLGLRGKLALLGAVASGCCSVSGDTLFPVWPFHNFVGQNFMIFPKAKLLPRQAPGS